MKQQPLGPRVHSVAREMLRRRFIARGVIDQQSGAAIGHTRANMQPSRCEFDGLGKPAENQFRNIAWNDDNGRRPLEATAGAAIAASAKDRAGNVEQTPHRLRLD